MFAAIEWETGIEEAFTDVATFVPKMVAALGILFVGWMIAKFVRRVANRVLDRVGLDEQMEKSGIPDALGRPIDGSKLASTFLYYLLMLTVLKLALSAFGENPLAESLDALIAFVPRLFVAMAIVVLAGIIARKVGEVASDALEGRSEQRLLTMTATTIIWVIGGFAAVDHLGVAPDIVDTLFQTMIITVAAIAVIQFGVGGIWSARDRFWPRVYDRIAGPATEVDLRETATDAAKADTHRSMADDHAQGHSTHA